MLILARHKEEEVVITSPEGEEISILVSGFDREHGKPRVRLGFKAPLKFKILRRELLDEIERLPGSI